MFLFRTAYQKLLSWKHATSRKPLLIRGARQVGKSSLVEEFGKKEFDHCVTINFEEDPAWKKIFKPDHSTSRIINEIEVKIGRRIKAESTLLFFDEIQQCPTAITTLRYFFEKAPEYYILAAGSLF